ncbi:HIT domain-containing protein [Candidatus Woesearchaeota archaeon]|nr:HIT domain-containing protein [Candidatus Woesearchaeota archaeon]
MAQSRESCIICQIVENKVPSLKVYEDDITLAVLDINGANPGHCFVMPKNHYPIIEQVPDEELASVFGIANKISSAIFDSLKVQGTNIFVANGIPAGQTVAHFMVNVIPRKENDGINLQWKPKQLSEEEMSTVELKLKEQVENIEVKPEKKKRQISSQKAEPKFISDEDDFFMSQMRRIP